MLKNAKKLERKGGRLGQSFSASKSDPQAEGDQEKAGSGNARQENNGETNLIIVNGGR